MNNIGYIQLDLFQPEPQPTVGSEELNFDLVLKDQCSVSVHFERHYLSDRSHLDFNGDISSTGYRSFFSSNDEFINDPDDIVIKKAGAIAGVLREERLKEIAKESRQRKPRRRNNDYGYSM